MGCLSTGVGLSAPGAGTGGLSVLGAPVAPPPSEGASLIRQRPGKRKMQRIQVAGGAEAF